MTDLDAFAAKLDEWGEAGDEAADRALRKIADRVADIQRERTKERTGATKRSISIDSRDGGYEIGPEGPRATDIHQEFGGGRSPANPFVGPSADYAEAHVAHEVAEEVEQTWR